MKKKIGFLLGISIFVLFKMLPAPAGLPDEGWDTAAIAVLMAVWWVTEALPIAVTALIPIVLFPILGVNSISEATASYANPIIFLNGVSTRLP